MHIILDSSGGDSRGETVVVAAIVCRHSAGGRGEYILTHFKNLPTAFLDYLLQQNL